MSKFKRLIALPCVIIFIALYLIGANLIKRIDRTDSIKESVPFKMSAEVSDDAPDSLTDGEDESRGVTEKININTANAEELTRIDGVGDKMASKIIEKRNEIGGFESVEQIKDVDGIGDKKFEAMEDFITIE